MSTGSPGLPLKVQERTDQLDRLTAHKSGGDLRHTAYAAFAGLISEQGETFILGW